MTNEETLKWFKDDLKNGKCSDGWNALETKNCAEIM